ncbi:MAG: LysR family transcriptional regulator [Glaciimonas sp.]|nr:LysR family transcriptional regulator [Glaciimonas sp.]
MQRMPPLNALQVFLVVARHRNFTRAAEHLCLTQGAVSRQILALEEHYGFQLFTRLPKGLALTVEGEILLPVVRESFARIEEISTRLTRQRNDLALKVPTCAMRWILPKIMLFQAEYADIQIQLTTTTQHNVDFKRDSFDAAIVYGTPDGEDVHSLLLFDEQLTPVCAPEILQGAKPLNTPADLSHHTLLHPTRDHRDWHMWLKFAEVAGVNPDSGQNFETLDSAMNAAAHGFGVAIGDCSLIREDIETKRLVIPFDKMLSTGQSYYLVYPNSVANQQKVLLFRDWMARLVERS